MKRFIVSVLLCLPFFGGVTHAQHSVVRRLDLKPPGFYHAAQAPRTALSIAPSDLTQWAPPVRDQGQLGSCAANVETNDAAWHYNHDFGQTFSGGFAPMFEYAQDAAANGGDIGSGFSQNLTIAEDQGNVPLSEYGAKPHDSDPQHAGMYDWQDLPSASDTTSASAYKIRNYGNLFATYPSGGGVSGYDSIVNQIDEGHPVEIGFTVTENYEFWNGEDPIAAGGSAVFGLHANLALKVDAAGNIWTLNSWGTSWGHAGYAILSPAFIEQMVEEAWGMTLNAPSPVPSPTPSPTPMPTFAPEPTSIPTSAPSPTSTPQPTPTSPPPPPPTMTPTKGYCKQWSSLFDERRMVNGKNRHAQWRYCTWYVSVK